LVVVGSVQLISKNNRFYRITKKTKMYKLILLTALSLIFIGFYFGTADPGSGYGAAGSIILILLWVSYSSMIVFLVLNLPLVLLKSIQVKLLQLILQTKQNK
jgi:uncharacterized BrkB/YihY/UPF0761 family membrane protein